MSTVTTVGDVDGDRAQTTPVAVSPAGGLRTLIAVGRPTALVVLITALIGFIASATLTIEKIRILTDPGYTPSCSLNPIISCGSVMKTWQAAIFGFPNPLIGIAAFAVVIVTGVLALTGVSLPRWYWLGQALATTAGFALINFLFYSSVYRIHALCPYCMAVWAITPIILILSVNRTLPDTTRAAEVRGWLWVLLPLWYAIVLVAIGVQFWDYWSTLI
ncbi:MAG: vitamin K epoxide reductase family protein [Gordonia sp. (in: high G+C Gram-positive bacteria)]